MVTNPLGLVRTGDPRLDLDQIFLNLQYLRDSLPQTTSLLQDVVRPGSGGAFVPIHEELSFPVSSLVQFTGYIYTNAYQTTGGISNALSVTGPPSALIRYHVETLPAYLGWANTSQGNYALFRLQGICQPTEPGRLTLTLQNIEASTVFRGSNLTLTLLG